MLKLFDFQCRTCGHAYEDLLPDGSRSACKQCGSEETEKAPGVARPFEVIRATSLTSLRYKAGSIHRFQNRPREKIGIQVPRSAR